MDSDPGPRQYSRVRFSDQSAGIHRRKVPGQRCRTGRGKPLGPHRSKRASTLVTAGPPVAPVFTGAM